MQIKSSLAGNNLLLVDKLCLLQNSSDRTLQWRHSAFESLSTCLLSGLNMHTETKKPSLFVRLKDTSNLNTKWLLRKLKLTAQNTIRTFSTWVQPVKRSAQELTCAGIVIDPDVARTADAHEGARGVNAHGVLPAVVLPFSALINIWREGRERGSLG